MSFLDSPTSPSQTSPSSSTSAHDSLNSFPGFPGIAETNLTTVLDDTSKQLIVPPSPSGAEDEQRNQQGVEDMEDVRDGEEQAPLPKAPPMHRRTWRTASTANTSRSASASTTSVDAYEEEEYDWHLESPGAASGTTAQTPTVVDHGLFSSSGARLEERSSDSTSSSGSSFVALPGRFQSAETQKQTRRARSYSSSSASSGLLGLEYMSSSASSSSDEEEEEEESPSSTTERQRWRNRDAQSAISSIPRIHIEADSLLFSHSPPRLTAKDKGKGKDTVTWKDQGKGKGKGKGKEREWEPAPEGFVRDVQNKAREKVQIQVPAALPQPLQRYHHRRKSSGTKIRTRDGVAVYKYQERGLSRDFVLIIGLCFGLACTFVLVARPAMLSVFGHSGAVGFSLDDLD